MKKIILLISVICCCSRLSAQELFVFTEPASNMPAKSLGLKYTGKFIEGYHTNALEQRHMLEVMLGLNKKWLVHLSTTISDMYSYPAVQWESFRAYGKYRFYSNDEIHKHLRAAAFLEASYSVNEPFYDEISMEGDQSGVRGGIIVTQLIHKLALSTTLSLSEVMQPERWTEGPSPYNYQSFNYSFSSGYLLFPRKYKSFKQTNFNLYLEFLGSSNLDKNQYYLDMAPAIQFIFNSNTKLNFGYRFQLYGNMHRMATSLYEVSIDGTFLNALKFKRK